MAEPDPIDAGSNACKAETSAVMTAGISEDRHDSFARTEHVKRLYFVQYLGVERQRRNPCRCSTIVGTGDWVVRALFRKAEISDGMSHSGPEPGLHQMRRSVDSTPMRFMSKGVVR